uniref:Uncharacterized protein n=1 Tax=Chromera velia CCMP2878 TaxID=1169474 RepID=A0A0G4FMW7_9ALVE|eukprot:Cvel_17861.t1-p1 / transcript=Cvel_17861.t1 / gene=Cvel_17861 / organism=Chromera_velia_CCMP2878 / gene_product=hypothetical protein / transcript_product=hypothetical protein / location=Cvel_scaffold1449:433-1575(-) / protein_length=381 / sequence_SO=supercontig / SO=protein_coding / is_pseudo=false
MAEEPFLSASSHFSSSSSSSLFAYDESELGLDGGSNPALNRSSSEVLLSWPSPSSNELSRSRGQGLPSPFSRSPRLSDSESSSPRGDLPPIYRPSSFVPALTLLVPRSKRRRRKKRRRDRDILDDSSSFCSATSHAPPKSSSSSFSSFSDSSSPPSSPSSSSFSSSSSSSFSSSPPLLVLGYKRLHGGERWFEIRCSPGSGLEWVKERDLMKERSEDERIIIQKAVREYWKVRRGKFKKRGNACYQDLTVSHPRDRLRFAYINVGGLQRKIRNGDIRLWLTETDADVVVLVETQHLFCDLELGGWKGVNWSHREWERRKTKVHSACVDKEIRSEGVCILVKSDRWGELRPEFELVGPSIARVAIHSSGRKLHMFGVYLLGG